ncbi:hypothetical protein [Xanthomonas hortorum]|uniref:Uncharacterized protein n=1 Tax=Xanthomonas hortorum pv. hederae TaxID=453603 RepID=A0A9X4BSH5_9XANT|nr:hypothetical protein [Xanthomonas hortorum]MCE4369715.1 hypothetical protein [Xanthomonas hortorum pv. hederae]MDC8638730.1 hypothetical protein [Xanthomonas hortorum pv. hederae]PPU86251.1 hypothetical protein XhhCFBP4925_00540 [Xanthomonas hortorum pv. hederae]PUF01378.1 hypothetical protein C7T87_03410 [Xanthomonas hortorum pv. hederae]
MSRHVVRSYRDSTPVCVVAGYDRPLRTLYLQVWEDPDTRRRCDQSVLFASHLDPRHDWSDIDSIADALAGLSIPVPESFLDAVFDDQVMHRGNLLRHHPSMTA